MRMLLLAGKHGQCLYFEQKTVGERSEGFYREIPDVTAALWRKSEYESVGRTKRETSLSSSATMNQFVHICLYQLTVPQTVSAALGVSGLISAFRAGLCLVFSSSSGWLEHLTILDSKMNIYPALC